MIRKANIKDAKAIACIRVDGWKSAYSGLIPESFLNSLNYEIEEAKVKKRIEGEDKEFTSKILVYEKNGVVLAFSYFGDSIDEKYSQYKSELLALYVMPSKKGNGIGTELLNEVKIKLKNHGANNMIVWCLKENVPSIKFYEHLGGVIQEERHFEIDGIDLVEVGIVYNF